MLNGMPCEYLEMTRCWVTLVPKNHVRESLTHLEHILNDWLFHSYHLVSRFPFASICFHLHPTAPPIAIQFLSVQFTSHSISTHFCNDFLTTSIHAPLTLPNFNPIFIQRPSSLLPYATQSRWMATSPSSTWGYLSSQLNTSLYVRFKYHVLGITYNIKCFATSF